MAHRALELTLVSAHSLKDVNLFSRMEVYAIASVYGNPGTSQRTNTDRDGARHPRWEDTLSFTVPPTAAAASASGARLHVLLRTERLFSFDDRDVGEVFLPLADLLETACASGSATAWHGASYQVRKVQCSERDRGSLSVSYRLGPVMAPALRDDVAYDVTATWQCYCPPYAYAPEYQAVYPPPFLRMPPAPMPGAGYGASAGMRNVQKNGGFALGLGARLLGGSFGGRLHGAAAANAGVYLVSVSVRIVLSCALSLACWSWDMWWRMSFAILVRLQQNSNLLT